MRAKKIKRCLACLEKADRHRCVHTSWLGHYDQALAEDGFCYISLRDEIWFFYGDDVVGEWALPSSVYHD